MNRSARAIAAFVIVVLALTADVWLIRRPEPHSVAEFSPFTTALGREELILKGPMSPAGPLLSHQGGKNEVVDIFFEKGILSDPTRKLLGTSPIAKSAAPQLISYTTLDSPPTGGAPCRTFVNIDLENAKASELHLSQRGLAGGERHREIEVESVGAPLAVSFQTMADDPAQLNQPGCRKLLQVGDSQVPLVGIPLKILADTGSSVRLKFMPASPAPIWKGARGLFEPFQSVDLRVQRVLVSPLGSQQEKRKVDATGGRPSINIENLLIGSNELQAALSGVGMVAIDGRAVGPTLTEWLSASYLRTAIVAFLNLLICWGALLVVTWRRPPISLPKPLGAGITLPHSQGLSVFLCHCSENKPAVRQLKQQLEVAGFSPWLDEEDIGPARLWGDEILQGLQDSQAIIVCLSQVFVHKEGFVQKELHFALEIAREKPDGAVFLIPVRLEECEIPRRLSAWQRIDLFKAGGDEKLKAALHERARQLGIEPQASETTRA
jgi:hypothetical protein